MLSNALTIRLHPLNLACSVEVYDGRIKKSNFLTVFIVFYIKTLVVAVVFLTYDSIIRSTYV